MDEIRQWSLAVSSIAIISGVLMSILPEKMHKNLFKLIVVIILIYAFMQPLIGSNSIDFKIDDFLKDNYQVSEDIDKYAMSSVINSAEKAIEDIFNSKASEENISCEFECECILKDDQISVRKIIVSSYVNENEKKIIEDCSESLGFDKSTVYFAGEADE